MQFDSVAAALAMDGHGAYVWAVVVISTLVIAGLLLGPGLRSRRLIAEHRGLFRRQQMMEESRASGS